MPVVILILSLSNRVGGDRSVAAVRRLLLFNSSSWSHRQTGPDRILEKNQKPSRSHFFLASKLALIGPDQHRVAFLFVCLLIVLSLIEFTGQSLLLMPLSGKSLCCCSIRVAQRTELAGTDLLLYLFIFKRLSPFEGIKSTRAHTQSAEAACVCVCARTCSRACVCCPDAAEPFWNKPKKNSLANI